MNIKTKPVGDFVTVVEYAKLKGKTVQGIHHMIGSGAIPKKQVHILPPKTILIYNKG